jgi:serine/threonine protein kinase
MALTSGQRIGRYEVVALLDGGGQGEVYRARDTRLSRDVALKVLSDERPAARHRARFEREAQALAALNHPNIAALVGVEDSPDALAIVMELIEGESLAARLAASGGRGLPAEALGIARQIADALQAAHERGLVHRDLKPANVMIRPDGTVKLVDFGLAKSFTDRGGDPAASTVTLTGAGGALIGTAAYMSPEQARGAAVDRRTDVWAFGCVLYEMLTGRRAFDGPTTSDVIASVLTLEPDLDALPPNVHGAIRRLLRRCFVKDPRNRLHDIGDARLEIEDALDPSRGEPASAARTAPASVRQAWPRYALAALAAAAIAAVAMWAAMRPRQDVRLPVSRSSIIFPAYSITKNGWPSGVVPASWIAAMPGGCSRASACRSDSNRARTCFESMPGLMTFMATSRRTGATCSARKTRPMPPVRAPSRFDRGRWSRRAEGRPHRRCRCRERPRAPG